MTIPEEEKYTHIFGEALSGDQSENEGGGRLGAREKQHRKPHNWSHEPEERASPRRNTSRAGEKEAKRKATSVKRKAMTLRKERKGKK